MMAHTMLRAATTIACILLLLIPLTACERDTPQKPIGSATNKHFEESPAGSPNSPGSSVTGTAAVPRGKARQADDAKQGAATSP